MWYRCQGYNKTHDYATPNGDVDGPVVATGHDRDDEADEIDHAADCYGLQRGKAKTITRILSCNMDAGSDVN